MSQTFGDLELAAKTKEVISTLVRKEVEQLRPVPRYATVATLGPPVTVTYSGDPTAVPVKTGSVVPSAVGQIVRIEGPPGDRYIADVVGVINETVPPYDPGGTGEQSNEFPDGVIIGEEGSGNEIIIGYQPPADVTGVTVTQGLEFENIYYIVEWDLAAGAEAYDVEVAEKLGANTYDLTRVLRVAGLTARIDGLQPYTEYGVRVTPVSNIGVRGNPTVWLDVATTGDSTIPPQIAVPTLSRGATSLIVSFTPLTSLTAPDVANGNGLYEVQIDTANTFNTANLRTSLGTQSVVAFGDLTFESTWYARVRAIDTSGNLGAWSPIASLVAGAITSGHIKDGAITETKITDNAITSAKIAANAVTADEIAAGVITSDKIVTAGLDAAVIKFGTMSGDRITANTLDVNRLKASTLTATIITLGSGGQIKIGNPTTNGIYINDQGIRAYAGGATTFQIDASGNATFSGSLNAATGSFAGTLSAGISISSPTISGGTITGSIFQTATSGARVVIDQTNREAVKFYDVNGVLIGTVGYKNAGWGEGLYLGATQVKITNLQGHGGTGSLQVQALSCNSMTAENITAYTNIYVNGTAVSLNGHTHGLPYHTHGEYSTTDHTHTINYSNYAGTAYAVNGTSWTMGGTCYWYYGGVAKAWLTASGAFTAASKNFDIPHPVKPDWRLRYASLEGPAYDVIHRGRIELENGAAVIDIDEAANLTPGTWAALTDPATWQVLLYNETGDANPKCEWIDGKIHVTCADQTGTISWVAIGTRDDFEPDFDTNDENNKLITEYHKYVLQ